MIKNIYKALICLATLSATGCNYLDFSETSSVSKEYAYGYFGTLESVVTNLYSDLQSQVAAGALRESASDNSLYLDGSNNIYRTYNGTWSPINPYDNQWSSFYTAIRSVNSFLESFDDALAELEIYEYNTTYPDLYATALYYPYEARFLRAFAYFELIRRYGDVPLVTKTLTTDEANSVKQSSFEDVVEFIVDEIDEIAEELPVSYSSLYNADTGRITRGAALALKARVLLYAASPLFNPSDDQSKWEAAADAAADVIALVANGTFSYSLTSGEFYFSSGTTLLNSTQLILERRNTAASAFETANYPISYEGATLNTANVPTQNLVDCYDLSDGTEFDWNNPDHTADPYSNRDPRFAKSILYNGATWQNVAVETYFGGGDGQPNYGATTTGYYLKKYVNSSVSLVASATSTAVHHWFIFRYAEILLNYAEAVYNATGSATTSYNGSYTALEALNLVRASAPMPTYSDDTDFVNRLRKERRIEFAYEDFRFWDIRRWKIGEQSTDIYGVNITMADDGSLTYEKELVMQKVWDDKMYLYPIPNSEILINSNLVQNPGW